MATVVSCYYRIKSKKSHEQYMDWISNFMSLKFNCIIFVNLDSKSILEKVYPESKHLKYVHLDFEDFITSKWDWKQEEERDPGLHFGHSDKLYQVWNEKPFMVKRAIDLNYFNSKKFIWMDIGSFRNKNHLPHLVNFPDESKIQSGVSIVMVCPFEDSEMINVDKVDDRFKYPVIRLGGTFGGDCQSLVEFSRIHHDIIDEFKKEKCFSGQDQSLYAFAVVRNPKLFNLICNANNRIDTWFCLQYLWS